MREFEPRGRIKLTPEMLEGFEAYETAYDQFLQALQNTRGVHAVAFLAVEYPELGCRPSLSVEVFDSFRTHTDEARVGVERVTDARAAFYKSMQPLMAVGLRFVNMNGSDLDSARRQMMKQWSEDPSLTLIDFIPFSRDS